MGVGIYLAVYGAAVTPPLWEEWGKGKGGGREGGGQGCLRQCGQLGFVIETSRRKLPAEHAATAQGIFVTLRLLVSHLCSALSGSMGPTRCC